MSALNITRLTELARKLSFFRNSVDQSKSRRLRLFLNPSTLDLLEERQLLATYNYFSASGLLDIQTNAENETFSIRADSTNGNYTLISSAANFTSLSGIVVQGLNNLTPNTLTIGSDIANLSEILITNNSANAGASFAFLDSGSNYYITNLKVNFNQANTGQITISNNATFLNNANLQISVNSNLISVSSSLSVGNNGFLSLSARNIQVNNGVLNTASGSINLVADSGTQQMGEFIGISIAGPSAKVSTAGGSINIVGRGAAGTISNIAGVLVSDNAEINVGGNGFLNINGTGGNGSGGHQYGVYFNQSRISSANGAITIRGASLGTSQSDIGVRSNAIISASGIGSVNITGIGGGGNLGNESGVWLENGNITTQDGPVNISGNSFGNNRSDFGVISSVPIISTSKGSINIRGVSGNGSGVNESGVWLNAGSLKTNNSSILIDGVSLGSDQTATGVRIESGIEVIASGTLGTIVVNGCTAGTGSPAIVINSGTLRTSNRPIQINTNSLLINNGSAIESGLNGSVFISTQGSGINLGGADNYSNLGLTQTELNTISAGLLKLGGPSTGIISLSTNLTWSSNLTLASQYQIVGNLTNNNTIFQQGSQNLTAIGTISLEFNNPLLVVNTADQGTGSLRYAVNFATSQPGDDVITFSTTLINSTILLQTPILINDGNGKISISGPGTGLLTIGGMNSPNLFDIQTEAVLSNLTLTNNSQGVTGGFSILSSGQLELNQISIANVTVPQSTALFQNGGSVFLNNSVIGNPIQVGNQANVTINGGVVTNPFSVASGNNITIQNYAQPLSFGPVKTNNLHVHLISGSISQSTTSNIAVSGTANLIAPGNSISLLNNTNDFNLFTANAGLINLNETNQMTVIGVMTSGGLILSGNPATSCISVSGPVLANSGTGSVFISGRNVIVSANILTSAGDIAIYGNGGGAYQAGAFDGVCISGSNVNLKTTGGNIVIDGRGAASSFNEGVNITSAQVATTGSGAISITAVSGNGSTAWGVYTKSASITTVSGDLSINGQSCSTAGFSRGVYLLNSANIASSGTGNVTITGRAANGTYATVGVFMRSTQATTNSGGLSINGTSCGTGPGSTGIYLRSSTKAASTGSGDVTITGTMCGTGGGARGVLLFNFANVTSSGSGNVTINGTTSTGTYNACGVEISGSYATTNSGCLTISGTACGTGNGSRGVFANGSVNVSSTGSGNVTITGTTANQSAIGIESCGTLDRIASGGGTIVLSSNSINLAGTVNATTAGNVIIQTLGAAVNLGGADNASNLGLTQSEISNITAGSLKIGSVTTGPIVVTSNLTLPANTSLTLLTSVTSSNITLRPGTGITLSGSGSISITARKVAVSGNLTTAAGDILIYGNGGGVYQSGSFNGVDIGDEPSANANVNINTSGGNIIVNGLGAAGSTGSGVYVNRAMVNAGGNGSISITGISGNGASTCYGVKSFSSTITTVNGNLTMNGTSNGSSTVAIGACIESSTKIAATGTGSIFITGKTNGGTDTGRAVLITGTPVTAVSGQIVIYGESCATGINACGVCLSGSANISVTGGGNISIAGQALNNTSNGIGIDIQTSAIIFSNGGQISLTSDKLAILTQINATTAGSVYIQTFGSGVNLGNATDTSSNLGLIQNDLNNITAGCLSIGSPSTGPVFITAPISRVNGTIGTNLTLISGNTISESGGNLVVAGAARFISGGVGINGNIDLRSTTNNFYSSGSISACGTNISITNNNATRLAKINGSELTVNSTGGNISQVSSSNIVISGMANLITSNTITLSNATNSIGNLILTTPQAVIDVNGNGTIGSSQTTNLTITGNGTLTQTPGTSIIVSGTANLSVIGNISLNSGSNQFNGPIVVLANVATVNGTGSMNFTNVTANTINFRTGNGNITQNGPWRISGANTTYLDANGSIILNNSGNDFYGAIYACATDNISITNANATVLGNVSGNSVSFSSTGNVTQIGNTSLTANSATITGNGSVNLTDVTANTVNFLANGSITQSGSWDITGSNTTYLTANGGSIILNDPSNDFNGGIYATATNDISIYNSDATLLGNVSGNSVSFSSTGNVTQIGNTSLTANSATITGNGSVNLTSVTANTINFLANGSITQSGGWDITGSNTTYLTANGGSIILNDPSNDFNGGIYATATNDISIYNSNSTILGNVSGNSVNFSSTGNVTQIGNTSLTANSATIIGNGSMNLTDVSANTINFLANGSITQSGSWDITGSNTTYLTANGGSIILNDPSNDFNGGIYATATNDISIYNSNSTILGNVSGNSVNFNSTGNVTQIGNTSLTANSATIIGNGSMNLTDVSANTINFLANGSITQSGSWDITGSNTTYLTAIGGSIILNNSSNDFNGGIYATATNDISIYNSNSTILGNVSGNSVNFNSTGNVTQIGSTSLTANSATISGNGSVNLTSVTADTVNFLANGSITQSGSWDITGSNTTYLTAIGGSIILNQVTNDFAGAIHANSTFDIEIYNSNVTILGNVIGANFRMISAGGGISQSPGTSITVAGLSNLTASGNTISLNQSNNNFGTIQASGTQLTLAEQNNITLHNIAVSNTVNITSADRISITGTYSAANTLLYSGALSAATLLATNLTINGNATSANIQTGGNLTGAAIVNAGNLISNGTMGSLTVHNGGTLTTRSTGTRIYGAISLNNGSIWNAGGASISDFSRITSTGLVTIAPGANLTLLTPANVVYPNGITLIDQTGTTPISQSSGFANFAQGTIFRNNNNTLYLNYNGSAGNYLPGSSGVDLIIQSPSGRLMVLNPNLTGTAGQQYSSNLNIQVVTDFNNPIGISGISVMVTLPANVNNCNIATGRFDNANYSNRTIIVTSDSNGNISIPIWANDNPGPFQANITNLNDPSDYNAPYFGVIGVAVQRQSINRSYIRYMDVVLSDANLTSLNYTPANFLANFTMTRTKSAGFSGGANITDNTNYLTFNSPNVYTTPVGYTVDFGPGGLGNQSTTATYDGVYQLVANGTVVPSNAPYSFHRLLGDANGDGTVNALDTNMIQTVLTTPAWRYQNASNLTYINSNMSATSSNPLAAYNWVGDLNGDGKINALDLNIAGFQRGRRVNYTRRVT